LAACDAAQVTPPTHFESWNDWKAWARRRGQVAPSQPDNRMVRPNVTTATVPSPRNPEAPTFIELRRQVGFLQILANRSTSLARVLGASPYMMPPSLIQQVRTWKHKATCLCVVRAATLTSLFSLLHLIDSSSLAAILHRLHGVWDWGEFILSRPPQWIWSCSSLAYVRGIGANANDLRVFECRTKKNGIGISIIRLIDEHGRSAKLRNQITSYCR
jgi:hypothetical protein